MAVIRQKTQIFNQPVGVVRTDAGGAQVGEAISNAASRISQLAYREAAINAEKAGQQAAQSQPSDKIIAINPDTNMPVAYTPPASFGTIAARSYQNMIDRRFEESILNEFALKGSEFAASSSTADQYKTRITKYIQEMYNSEGEATPYSRYIQEAGSEYVASTYASLAKRQAEAAKKALTNQQLMSGYLDEKKLANLVASGGSDEEILDLTNALRAKYLDLKNTNSITFKQWASSNDRIDGLQGLSANNNLIDIYSTLSPSDQSMFKLGLTNPTIMARLANNIENNSLEALAVQAKTTTSIPTLLAGLDSFSSISKEYVQSEVNNYISELAPTISASTTPLDISTMILHIEDDNIAKEVGTELFADWVEKNLDVAGKKSSDLDIISEALQNEASPDYQAIANLIGGNRDAFGRSHGDKVAGMIQTMTQEQRSNLATEISDRRAALSRMENTADLKKENRLRQSLINFQNSTDLNASFQSALSNIEASGLDERTQQTLITAARENFALQSRVRADKIQLTTVDLEELKDAVTQEETNLIGNAKQAYDLLREAYKFDPASTSSYLEKKLTAATNQNNRYINGVRIDAIESNISDVSPNELAFYDKQLFGDVVMTAGNMFDFPQIVDGLNQGVVLPSAKVALESALTSNNEDNLNAGIQAFERYSNLEAVTEDGRRTGLDTMRKYLGSESYALYSAISQSARAEGVEPLSIALEFRNYDGNIDADIKADLELSKNANIGRVLDAYPMSNNYKKEILAMLRMQKVRGNVITEDSISSIIDSYTSKMRTDPNVIGSYIGDSTVYARNNFFADSEIIAHREEVTNLIADSGLFNDLLKGGTALDAAAAGFANIIGGNLLLTSKAIVEEFTSGVGASEKLNDRDRLRRGLQALNIELSYKPVVSSFNQGQPMYEVGYINDYGGFDPIIVNDTALTLEKPRVQVNRKADMRFQSLNNLQVAFKADAPDGDKVIAEITYKATLDHMTEDMFLSDVNRIRRFNKILGDDDMALNIFRAKRESYNALSNALQIEMTEPNQ
jgi:hypothetical protein